MRQQRNGKRVAETHKPRHLIRAVAIQRTAHMRRLVGDDADDPALHPRQADDAVAGKLRLNFQKTSFIRQRLDDPAHVICPAQVTGTMDSISSDLSTTCGSAAGGSSKLFCGR